MRGKTPIIGMIAINTIAASMRPPHECGGKPRFAARARLRRVASMRPPHECGGKLAFRQAGVAGWAALQ